MNVTIVYETVFGTTRALAQALADGVQQADPRVEVSVLSVDDADPDRLSSAGLLLVGGPTHAFGMSRPGTRRSGREGADAAPAGTATLIGVREWLQRLGPAAPGARAAAFSTKLPSRFSGNAAVGIARRLRHLGYDVVGHEGFTVGGAIAPLPDRERDRARDWAAHLLQHAAAPPPELRVSGRTS